MYGTEHNPGLAAQSGKRETADGHGAATVGAARCQRLKPLLPACPPRPLQTSTASVPARRATSPTIRISSGDPTAPPAACCVLLPCSRCSADGAAVAYWARWHRNARSVYNFERLSVIGESPCCSLGCADIICGSEQGADGLIRRGHVRGGLSRARQGNQADRRP